MDSWLFRSPIPFFPSMMSLLSSRALFLKKEVWRFPPGETLPIVRSFLSLLFEVGHSFFSPPPKVPPKIHENLVHEYVVLICPCFQFLFPLVRFVSPLFPHQGFPFFSKGPGHLGSTKQLSYEGFFDRIKPFRLSLSFGSREYFPLFGQDLFLSQKHVRIPFLPNMSFFVLKRATVLPFHPHLPPRAFCRTREILWGNLLRAFLLFFFFPLLLGRIFFSRRALPLPKRVGFLSFLPQKIVLSFFPPFIAFSGVPSAFSPSSPSSIQRKRQVKGPFSHHSRSFILLFPPSPPPSLSGREPVYLNHGPFPCGISAPSFFIFGVSCFFRKFLTLETSCFFFPPPPGKALFMVSPRLGALSFV